MRPVLAALICLATIGCDCGAPFIPVPDPDAGRDEGDSGNFDAGYDGGGQIVDAGTHDAGSPDAGAPDAGPPDGGPVVADAGAPVPDGGTDSGTPIPDAGPIDTFVMTADDRVFVDEEFVTRSTTNRLHIRDDGKACGGFGAVRSMARWDVAALAGKQVLSATVMFRYGHAFNQYGSSPRLVALHEVLVPWVGSSMNWSTMTFSPSPLGVITLTDAPDAGMAFPVPASLVQGWIDSANPSATPGVLVKFVSETCPGPRWPAELDINPELQVDCR